MPTDEKPDDDREWFDNIRTLTALIAELYELAVNIVDADARSPRADRMRAAASESATQRSRH